MWRRYMVFCFFLNGSLGVAPTMLHKAGYDAYRGNYLFVYFATALALILVFIACRRKHIALKDLMIGGLMGLLSLVITVLTLVALSRKDAACFWPLYTAGHVLAACLLSYVLWNEKPNGILGYVGIGVGMGAMVLLAA